MRQKYGKAGRVGVLVCGLLILALATRRAQAVSEDFKLAPSDSTMGNFFGHSTALDGNTAIVGSRDDAHDSIKDVGIAYVFIRTGKEWIQQATLTESDSETGDMFGYSVSISGDTTIIGAASNNGIGLNSGSAYIFTRSSGVWTQQAILTANDAAADDYFGQSVSISGDTAIIGAHRDDYTDSGSVYVFTRSGVVWTQQAKITASDVSVYDNFGRNVLVSGDTAIIGAYQAGDGGEKPGRAYIFTRSGGVWTQQAKLTASDGEAGDAFGFSFSISGNTALIGAGLDDDGGTDSGSAYVFTRSGGVWTQQAKITANDATTNEWFGSSVSILGDTAIIGAQWSDDGSEDSGSAYIFTSKDGIWTQKAKLTASDASEKHRLRFGYSVSISGDAAIVGTNFNAEKCENSGGAYVFDLTKPKP